MVQPRILVLSKTAYYRVHYTHKKGQIDHYHKTPLEKLRVVEKTANGVKVFLTEQDGNTNIGKTVLSWMGKAKPKDEFEHVREYLPTVAANTSIDLMVDAIAATLHKAAEMCSAAGGHTFAVPQIITTNDRKKLLADRREAERLEKERIEREAAAEELRKAMEQAKVTRGFDGLAKPLRRAKKAIDFDAELLQAAEALKTELEEEKKERELQERLEKERVEREAATEELSNAVEAAKKTRDEAPPAPSEGGATAMGSAARMLEKPLKRAKKAVDFDAELLQAAEALKAELDEAKKERERLEAEAARLEKERVEREAATEELASAVEAAKKTRDEAPPAPSEGGATAMGSAARMLEKPLKRAKKAVDFPEGELATAEALKAELDEAKKECETAERLEKERVEREAATAELEAELEKCEESRDPTALVKALKRAKKAVDVSSELIGKGEGLKAACDEEKRAAAAAAKEAAAAAKAEQAAKAKADAEAAAAAKAEAAAAASEAS